MGEQDLGSGSAAGPRTAPGEWPPRPAWSEGQGSPARLASSAQCPQPYPRCAPLELWEEQGQRLLSGSGGPVGSFHPDLALTETPQ